MRKIDTRTCLMLLPGRLLSVRSEQELHLRMECGLAWITIEGDEQDYWLSAGAGLRLPAQRHVVIEAWQETVRVELAPPASATANYPRAALAPTMLIEEI